MPSPRPNRFVSTTSRRRSARSSHVARRRPQLERLESRDLMATFTVDTTVDENDGNFAAGDLSLREALFQANATPAADTIQFGGAVSGQTLTLTPGLGSLNITNPVSIQGPGAKLLAISGNHVQRVFINSSYSGESEIADLTIKQGQAAVGGGVTNSGTLTLTRTVLTENNASGTGASGGGAIYAGATANTIIRESLLHANTSDTYGGAIDVAGGDLWIINSTLSGNTADIDGGGLHSNDADTFTITNTTITGNRAKGNAGGMKIGGGLSGGLLLNNTIVAGNVRGLASLASDVYGLVNGGNSWNNLIGDPNSDGGLSHNVRGNIVGNGGSGVLDIAFILDTKLADNGGPTFTHSLLPGSPALEAGRNASAVDRVFAALTVDQRGKERFLDDNNDEAFTVDIGAYEGKAGSVMLSGTTSYTENAAPTVLAAFAEVPTPASGSFNGGKLTVSVSLNAAADDRLSFLLDGNGPGQVSRIAEFIRYGGVTVGSAVGGNGTTPLEVTFNSNASHAAVQAVVRHVTFATVGDTPSTLQRNVRFTVADSAGASNTAVKKVNVIGVNDAPVVVLGGDVAYKLNGAGIAVAPVGTVSDPDGKPFAGGRLTISITKGMSLANRLTIGGPFVMSGNDVKLNGLKIGTRNADGGNGKTDLVISLNSNATVAVTQQLLQAIRFRTVNASTTAQRAISFTLLDGKAGLSASAVKNVNVTQ